MQINLKIIIDFIVASWYHALYPTPTNASNTTTVVWTSANIFYFKTESLYWCSSLLFLQAENICFVVSVVSLFNLLAPELFFFNFSTLCI